MVKPKRRFNSTMVKPKPKKHKKPGRPRGKRKQQLAVMVNPALVKPFKVLCKARGTTVSTMVEDMMFSEIQDRQLALHQRRNVKKKDL